jgi:hypothetical protein
MQNNTTLFESMNGFYVGMYVLVLHTYKINNKFRQGFPTEKL